MLEIWNCKMKWRNYDDPEGNKNKYQFSVLERRFVGEVLIREKVQYL